MNDLHVTIRPNMPAEVPLFRWHDRARDRETVWLNPDQRALWPAAAAEVGLDLDDLLSRATVPRDRPARLADEDAADLFRAVGPLTALLLALVGLELSL